MERGRRALLGGPSPVFQGRGLGWGKSAVYFFNLINPVSLIHFLLLLVLVFVGLVKSLVPVVQIDLSALDKHLFNDVRPHV